MAGGEVLVLDALERVLRQAEVGDHVLGGVVRRRQVVVAVLDPHAQVRVDPHQPLELVGDVDRLAFELLERPLLDGVREDLVGEVLRAAELAAQVVVHGRGERRVDRVDRRVGVHVLGDPGEQRAGVAAVDPADGEAAVAEHLGAPPPVLDAQLGAVDVLLADARQPGQRRHDRGPFLRGQPAAAGQRQPVGPRRELLGLGAHLLERPALVQAVVVGDGGVRREEVQAGLVGAEVLEVLAAEVDHAGHQHQPVERHRVHLREPLGDGDGAGRAVGLADHVLRRHPPVLACAPQPDQLGDLLHVLAEPVVLAGLPARDRAAVAGRHRVDEDQVAHGEQGLGVVDQRVRRRGRRVHAAHVDAARAEQPHCSQIEAEPGPPLKTKAIGRWVTSAPSARSRVYAVTDSSARAFQPVNFSFLTSSSRSTMRPVRAV